MYSYFEKLSYYLCRCRRSPSFAHFLDVDFPRFPLQRTTSLTNTRNTCLLYQHSLLYQALLVFKISLLQKVKSDKLRDKISNSALSQTGTNLADFGISTLEHSLKCVSFINIFSCGLVKTHVS